MSTLIGSNDSSIYLETGLVRLRLGGEVALEITDPGESGGGFASKEYVDQRTISDLATQDGNVATAGHTWTNVGAPVSGNDLATKAYTDDAAQISLGIANNTIVTSALTAGESEVTCGTTSLSMNG